MDARSHESNARLGSANVPNKQQPQRPVRLVKVYGDENAIPTAGIPKTIHQRNKSSPALSTAASSAAWKNNVKRTAFGDVTNKTNNLRPSKDDSNLNTKIATRLLDKVNVALPHEKKPVTLQRPAQRPLSSILAKTNILSTTTAINAAQVPAPEPLESSQSIQVPITVPNNVLAPRSSNIGKEAVPPAKQAKSQSVITLPPTNAPVPPVHRELSQASLPKTVETVPEPRLRRSQSKILKVDQVPAKDLIIHKENVKPNEDTAVKTDHVYIDDNGAIHIYEFGREENVAETVELAGVQTSSQLPLVDEKAQNDKGAGMDHHSERQAPSAVPDYSAPPELESEEYWDEDGVDNYEEEGYVTARSFKSRTDNTTGNATTVLFPKVTQRVKKELAAAKDLIEGSKTIEEMEDEAWDTTMVAEYGDEIFQYMKDLEIKMLPNAHYMDNQAEIQWSMRAVLMDWIVQVHHRFNLLPETLFLCVNYIDRFLSCKVVSLGKLQLVGATAIFIAAKYEEIDCPSVQEINYMVDNGYTVDEILKAERFMLSMLQFELGWPGPMSFLRRISKADDYDLETRTLAKYFLEITIMDERFVGSPPSFLAAGAHCLARMMLKKGNWSPAHVYYSNYTYSQLFNLVLMIVECCEDARKHHCAIFDKYTDKRYKRASQFAETEMRNGFQVLDVASHNSPYLSNGSNLYYSWEHNTHLTAQVC